MQPNQPFPPVEEPNQNNEPTVDPSATPPTWNSAPAQQPITPQQPAPPVQPAAAPQPTTSDYARYQPQPLQSTTPVPIQQTPTTSDPQPAAPVQSDDTQPVLQPQPLQPNQIQSPPPVIPQAPSQFEQQYEPALKEPPRKKSHVGLIIASILTAVLLLGGGAAAYLWMQDQNDPEKRFYRAIENHLSTKLIQQDYDQKGYYAGEVSAVLKSTSDFTDPKAPKSYVKYKLDTTSPKMAVAGEILILDDKEYYAKLSKTVDYLDEVGLNDVDPSYLPVPNQWYRTDTDDFGGSFIFDPGQTTNQVNTPTGEILVGNFNQNTRIELMKFIKEKNVYTINSSKEAMVDGQKLTQYDIKLNNDALNALNKKAIKALGMSDDIYKDKDEDTSQTNTLWIDNKTSRIVKAELTRDSSITQGGGKKVKDISTVTIRYPTSTPQITKPENAKDVPWSNL